MNLSAFNGLRQLRSLPEADQERCDRLYKIEIKKRLIPLFLQIAILINIVVSLMFVVSRAFRLGTGDAFKGGVIYLAIVTTFLLILRFSRLRTLTPLNIYVYLFLLQFWAAFIYVYSGGNQGHLVAISFTLASMGWFTLSIKHTAILWAIYVFFIWVAICVYQGYEGSLSLLLGIVGVWLVIVCFGTSLATAWFSGILFKNIFALQFILSERNVLLEDTLETLHLKERQLSKHQKHQALSHMAAGLLHEIMNPVNNSIQALTYAQTINKQESLFEPIADALSNQKRVVGIINDLRSYTSDKPDGPKSQENIASITGRALLLCKSELGDIAVEIKGGSGESVPCFPGELLQLCINLVLNSVAAIKCSREADGELIVQWGIDNDSCKLVFQDNGVGMPEEHVARIMEPFYSNAEGDHLGLGLSICQTIVKHHGGDLLFESELGEGTKVSVILPV